jgi:hypothetical protein
MNLKKAPLSLFLLFAVFNFACVYIVLPEGLETPNAESHEAAAAKVWNAFVTSIEKSDTGGLRVGITIRNDTGDWAAMEAMPGKPAVLTTSDGKTVNCEKVFVGTGVHRLSPGFQTRGYTAGKKDAPETQLLYVECAGVSDGAGATLKIQYRSFGGILDDYDPEANKTEGVLDLNLDQIASDLQYPIGTPLEGLILEAGTSITGLSDNVVTLLDVQRADSGFQFTWQNFNPTKFPLKTHIGIPPVIGSDGVIYGLYETLDIPPIPITPPGESAEWTTEVAVPADAKGFYILLSVESKKPRTYINYVLDVSDK